MTKLLVNIFVKDNQNIKETRVRTAYGVLASIVGIFCNLLLFVSKLIVGVMLKSISVTADAFNNLSDAASSIISFIGVKMASKPADSDHPFGHGRIEYIAAFIVSFLVIQVGFTFFKSSIDKIRNPEELSFQVISLVVLLLSVAVKVWLSVFNRVLGTRINSTVMKATAADALGDVGATSATILSVLVFRFTGINIDGIIGLIVSLIIIWAGISIAKDTLEPLIGQAVDPAVYRQITEFVEKYDGIAGSHDLIVHNYGPSKSMASIHAEVPNDVNIEVSHEVIDKIERDALRELGIFLVIHMDPIETKDDDVRSLRIQTEQIVKTLDQALSIHDFRLVKGEQQMNLIFDLVLPYGYDQKQENEMVAAVKTEIKKLDNRYKCVITVDKTYIAKES